ncbi:MAG: flavoprotein, partial [Terriglobales bacterium]
MPDRPVLLGVSGGVAAYKACELVRELQQRGHRVQVILTRGGSRFVSPLTFAALTGEPV